MVQLFVRIPILANEKSPASIAIKISSFVLNKAGLCTEGLWDEFHQIFPEAGAKQTDVRGATTVGGIGLYSMYGGQYTV